MHTVNEDLHPRCTIGALDILRVVFSYPLPFSMRNFTYSQGLLLSLLRG
jgi:hypothetical protein